MLMILNSLVGLGDLRIVPPLNDDTYLPTFMIGFIWNLCDHASRLVLDVCTSYCRAISCDSRCCSVHYSTVRQIEGSFSNNSWARKWLIESNNTILAKWNQDVDDVLSRIKSIMNNWHYSFFFLEINNE